MTARSLFDIAMTFAGAGQPEVRCRPGSVYPDDRRALAMWKPIDRKAMSVSARLRTAEEYDRVNKQPGKRNGPIGHIGLEVLRYMYRIVDFKDGRLEPSIATIMAGVKRSRQAVTDALARLRGAGFINWVRRKEDRDDAEGAGPQVAQMTSAYQLTLPQKAIAYINHLTGGERKRKALRKSVERKAAQKLARDLEAMPARERFRTLVADRELADSLFSVSLSPHLLPESANLLNERKPALRG